MITNASLTVYHYIYDEETRLNKWIRFNYGDDSNHTVWWHGGRGAGLNEGYDNANDVKIRIPYDKNEGLDIKNFKVGDILIKGTLEQDIATQQDLENYEIYNITSMTNNTFGNNQHIHLGGK